MNQLTFDETSSDVECHDHTSHADESLSPAAQNIKHVTSEHGNSKRPAIDNDVNLCLSSRVLDSGLVENLCQIKAVTLGQMCSFNRICLRLTR